MNEGWSLVRRKIHDWVREFYFGSGNHRLDRFIRWGLAPLTGVYALGRSLHQAYRYRRRRTVDVPVVSVGNISVGGTGKTPFVSWFIDELRKVNVQPGILKRGEGSTDGSVPVDFDNLSEISRRFGDEATLLRHRFPEIPIFVGSDRIAGAHELLKKSSPDLLLLDDGFQYRCLHRDLDVVLLRPSDYRNHWQLPSGPLREPLTALTRADFVSIYGSSRDKEELQAELPSDPRKLSHRYEFSHVERNGFGVTGEFRRDPAVLVTTLARPSRLEEFLDQSGFSLKRHVSLPDHSAPDQVVREELDRGERVLVTTKEWVKLAPELRGEVGVVRSTMRVESSQPLLAEIKELLINH